MSQPEIGPNDIVIHLVNPYRCGDCGAEFCARSLFLEHLAEHIDMFKAATPCHQIVCATSLVEQQSTGITVTRDILQINEEQMFELQDASIDYTQLTPLKTLEQAGILSLPRPVKGKGHEQPELPSKENPIVITDSVVNPREDGRPFSILKSQSLLQDGSGLNVQILNTKTGRSKVFSDTNQITIQNIQEDSSIAEIDPTVHQALFGDGKLKGEHRITVQHKPGQSLTEDSDMNVLFNALNEKSILGRGKLSPTLTAKGNKRGVVCLICLNIFANAGVLERHQVVHTEARPYSCNICFKVFSDISSHRKHSFIHKRNHRCPVCHRMYLRRAQLHLHLKQHKKKRFIQFGKNFHEVQVNVTRNADGQLVQEYSLPIFSALQGERSNDLPKDEDQVLVKEELEGVQTGVRFNVPETEPNISNLVKVEGNMETDQKKKVIYRCGHCKMLIYSRPTLSRHLIKHTNTRPFQCDFCLKCFHDKADLLHHHKTHTKPVQCKTCLSSFSKVLYLQNHLLKGCPVTDGDSRFTLLPDLKCRCNICQKVLKNKANVLRHLRIHAFQDRHKTQTEGEAALHQESLQNSELENMSQNVEDHFQSLPNSVGYHCLICEQEFRFKSFMITHVRMHLNQRPYKCPECSKSFFARQKLKKHQENHTRPYKCPACGKSFIRRYLMKDHFKKRHEQEDPLKDITELLDEKLIQCDICGKTMKSFQKSVMLSHIRLHKDVRPFQCKLCQKSFISDNALRKHSLNHSKPYRCNVCDKGFSRRYLLTEHFSKKCGRKRSTVSPLNEDPVTNEPPQENNIVFKEEIVPVVRVDASTECRPYEPKIISEQDVLTGTSTYTCEPCDKRFTLYEALMRHIHTFSKPTPCKYCKQGFEDKHLTMSHQRSCLGPSMGSLPKSPKKSLVLGEKQEKVQNIMKNLSQKISTLTSGTSSIETSKKRDKSEVNIDSSCNNGNLLFSSDTQPNVGPHSLNAKKEVKDRLSCPECDRNFDTPRGLKIHASTHVKLFKCGVCDKDFTLVSDLRAHANTHRARPHLDIEPEVKSSTGKSPKIVQVVISDENQSNSEEVNTQKVKDSSPIRNVIPCKKKGRKDSNANQDSIGNDVHEMNVVSKDLEEVSQRLMQSGTRFRPYSCRMCRRRFTEQSGLDAHVLNTHGGSTI